jgi:hypothetical protein
MIPHVTRMNSAIRIDDAGPLRSPVEGTTVLFNEAPNAQHRRRVRENEDPRVGIQVRDEHVDGVSGLDDAVRGR